MLKQNMEQFTTDKLIGSENWIKWKWIVEGLLMEKEGAYEVCSGELDKPEPVPDGASAEIRNKYSSDLAKYDKGNRVARGIFSRTLDSRVCDHVCMCKTAREIWQKLHDLFEQKNERAQYAENELVAKAGPEEDQLANPDALNKIMGDMNVESEVDAKGIFGKLMKFQTNPSPVSAISGLREDKVYSMKYPKKGRCLIFNHKKFKHHTGLKPRKGADADERLLNSTFTELGFQVSIYADLNKDELVEKLEEVGKEDHTENSCFICCILSHGEPGFFYAYDDKYETDRVFIPFRGDACPTLVGKPKIFFIQTNYIQDGSLVMEFSTRGNFSEKESDVPKPSLTVPSFTIGYGVELSLHLFSRDILVRMHKHRNGKPTEGVLISLECWFLLSKKLKEVNTLYKNASFVANNTILALVTYVGLCISQLNANGGYRFGGNTINLNSDQVANFKDLAYYINKAFLEFIYTTYWPYNVLNCNYIHNPSECSTSQDVNSIKLFLAYLEPMLTVKINQNFECKGWIVEHCSQLKRECPTA